MSIKVRQISAEETRSLRQIVLRPGLPAERNIYPLDNSGRDIHYGAFEEDNLVGTASIFNEPLPGREDPRAWRLRGMTVLPSVQRRGIGRTLLEACILQVRLQGGSRLWCNARRDAILFYQNYGFEFLPEAVDVPDEGLHQRMVLTLSVEE
jgi:GNAT superfamily N-acetyltransferase